MSRLIIAAIKFQPTNITWERRLSTTLKPQQLSKEKEKKRKNIQKGDKSLRPSDRTITMVFKIKIQNSKEKKLERKKKILW